MENKNDRRRPAPASNMISLMAELGDFGFEYGLHGKSIIDGGHPLGRSEREHYVSATIIRDVLGLV